MSFGKLQIIISTHLLNDYQQQQKAVRAAVKKDAQKSQAIFILEVYSRSLSTK